jgi:hypothetical protein
MFCVSRYNILGFSGSFSSRFFVPFFFSLTLPLSFFFYFEKTKRGKIEKKKGKKKRKDRIQQPFSPFLSHYCMYCMFSVCVHCEARGGGMNDGVGLWNY